MTRAARWTRGNPAGAPMGDGLAGGSGAMFDRIAARYDLLNRVLSMGIDRRWRRRAVGAMALGPGHEVLDVATGTGDLALEVARRHPDVRVLGVDPSPNMVSVGAGKVAAARLSARVRLEQGDAQQLRLDDASFDGVCMAFGIRNVPDRARALREMARVTRPGGRVVILELSEPRAGWIAPLARFHIRHVVPRVGAMLSGAAQYRYLEASIAAFPSPGEFSALMQSCGLRVLHVHPLTFGVCVLYVAEPSSERA